MQTANVPISVADVHVLQVHEEVQFQVKRINWHPSVVIWGGNNEVETAMGSWFEASRQNPSLYVADYAKVFLDTIQQAVFYIDTKFPFVDSSPSNGVLSPLVPYVNPYVKRYVMLLPLGANMTLLRLLHAVHLIRRLRTKFEVSGLSSSAILLCSCLLALSRVLCVATAMAVSLCSHVLYVLQQ